MRGWLFALLIAAPVTAYSDEQAWEALSGPEIASALTGQVLDYDTAWQDFRASGRTLYHAGRDSWGYWVVRDDQYCSMWPPSDLWACYDMARQGDMLRFIGENGDTTDGVLRGPIQ